MKRFLISAILILSACAATFAQARNISPCPTIDIYGPPRVVNFGDEMTFTAVVSDEDQRPNLKYVWEIFGAKIVDSQGTLKIRVLSRDEDAGGSITATIKIIGLPAECQNNELSASAAICSPPESRKIDEITTPVSKIEKGRLETQAIELNNNPSGQLYIIINHKRNASEKAVLAKEKSLINALYKAGIEQSRFTIIRNFSKTESIEFWIVPAGATPPTPEAK